MLRARKASGVQLNYKPDCVATINVTLNNTHISIAKPSGEIVSKATGGMMGFSGPERASAQAAQAAAKQAAEHAREAGLSVAHVRFMGLTRARKSALDGLTRGDLAVSHFEDVTPFPTNGCRARKTRRL